MDKKKETLKERILHTKTSKWIKFSIVSLLYIGFVIWDNNYWLLLGLPIVFDIYISKIIPWNGWKNSKNKSLRVIADWADAIIFALIAVYFIHIFIFQNYKIPTSSLEKTLRVGDYLLVSKLSYGPRVPNTPLAFPMMHHTVPILNTKSYSDCPLWGYKRLKGFGNVERYDIVVFNLPAGDTVALKKQDRDYYELVYNDGWEKVNTDKATYGDIVYRPVDRRENYVKRCVGMPGDTFQIINNTVYIDGKALETPKNAQFNYYVETHGNHFTEKQFKQLEVSKSDRFLINDYVSREYFDMLGITENAVGGFNPVYRIPLTKKACELIQKNKWAKSVRIEPDDFAGKTYPYTYETGWTRDNFGPLWIPEKGKSITLDEKNIALYSRCIKNYEGNKMRVEDGKIFINDVLTDTYTFKYDYYFMMGDNRHNSLDSRYWGFVPEDHIVGQPILIEISIDQDYGFCWDRLLRLVKNQ